MTLEEEVCHGLATGLTLTPVDASNPIGVDTQAGAARSRSPGHYLPQVS